MTNSEEHWVVGFEGIESEQVVLSGSLLEELALALPDATARRGARSEVEADTRSLAGSDWGLILIALTPFLADQLVTLVRSWVARRGGTERSGGDGGSSNNSQTEFKFATSKVTITLRRSVDKREL